MNPFIVAIDGGAASGKSSTARALSERFNFLHVDTGSFYRAISAELLRRKLTPADLPAIIAALPAIRLGTRVNGRTAHMEIDGRPVDVAEIRSQSVNATVAKFAPISELRAALLGYQRDQASVTRAHGFRGLVMEGRDIGSKIFPGADLRFFLHADLEERARRRASEGLRDKIAERDILDNKRLLESAKGAIMIDSTNLTLEQVVEKISAIVAEKLTDVTQRAGPDLVPGRESPVQPPTHPQPDAKSGPACRMTPEIKMKSARQR